MITAGSIGKGNANERRLARFALLPMNAPNHAITIGHERYDGNDDEISVDEAPQRFAELVCLVSELARMDDHARIERETGLVRLPSHTQDGLPAYVHASTRQQFVLIPGGSFLMGMTAAELVGALKEISYDPDVETWRKNHRAAYAAATPVHSVTIQPFLCGRSPLLGRTIEASGTGALWSVHATAEHSDGNSAAEVRADAAMQVLRHYGWELINEAQWEYVARRGARDEWAGGANWRKAATVLIHDPRCSDKFTHSYGWGIWGLALGEWVADQWRDSYEGAPIDGSAWRLAIDSLPGAMRGGGVLHAPWQDSAEAISCHAATRAGNGAWRGSLRARPVIPLPWLSPMTAPPHVDYDVAVKALEQELRATKERQREAALERRNKLAEAQRSLLGGPQKADTRSGSHSRRRRPCAGRVARRTQTTGLAAERHEHLVLARRAHHTCEAALDDAAVEGASKAGLDVAGQSEPVNRARASSREYQQVLRGQERAGGPARDGGRDAWSRTGATRTLLRARAARSS